MNDRAKKYEFEEVVIMKRLIAMVLCLLFVISLAGCGKGNTKNLVIDYGTSSIYTKDDMDEAIDVIKKQFSSLRGVNCTAYLIHLMMRAIMRIILPG